VAAYVKTKYTESQAISVNNTVHIASQVIGVYKHMPAPSSVLTHERRSYLWCLSSICARMSMSASLPSSSGSVLRSFSILRSRLRICCWRRDYRESGIKIVICTLCYMQSSPMICKDLHIYTYIVCINTCKAYKHTCKPTWYTCASTVLLMWL